MTQKRIALVGFGEAAQAFVEGMAAPLIAYDIKMLDDETRLSKLAEIAALGIEVASANTEAITGAGLILSLVTADQALAAAAETACNITAGALYCDMNSVAPDTKAAAAALIEAAGGRYVDVAVMAPAYPARRKVPLLAAGPYATVAAEALRRAGFENVRVIGDVIGSASSIKLIRSVMVKGLEALSAECAIAAYAAGVLDEVVASLDASSPNADWAARMDYNLDRMMVHGQRRSAEMQEAAATLAALGVDPVMTKGTAARQSALGLLRIAPPAGIDAKLTSLAPFIIPSKR